MKKHNRYRVREWEIKTEASWKAILYLGGELGLSEVKLRELCFPKGLCVTIKPTKYIFAGGTEDGIEVGFIQYPPFPEKIENLKEKAIKVGKELCKANYQWSFTIVFPDETVYYSRRCKEE